MPPSLDEIKQLARAVVAREELGIAPPAPEPKERRPGFPAQLFAREELPLDPEPPKETGPGLMSRLFGFETLPEEPPAVPHKRLPLLRWWFLPERLDDGK